MWQESLLFGRWKNRFRFLLKECDLTHPRATRLIYVSMIMHNLCTIRKDDAVDFREGSDEEWLEFFDTYESMSCPSCTRKGSMHCPHVPKWLESAETIPLGVTALARREAIRDKLWDEMIEDDTLLDELHTMEERAEEARGERD